MSSLQFVAQRDGRVVAWAATILVALAVLFPVAAFAIPPVVKTVPWVASTPLIPHDTWSGRSVRLKGTSDQQGATIQYSWDFGDGSPVTAFATVTTANMFGLEASHVYTGATGTVFTARLTVRNTATGETGSSQYYVVIRDRTLGVESNVAIDEGLWYLHKTMTRSGTEGYWATSYNTETASNLNAFFVNGHLETGAPTNPYTDTVQRGMRRLFTLLTAYPISAQTYSAPIGVQNPDANGNGLGIYGYDTYTYSGGIFMDAIVASGTPNAVTTTGPANVIGRTYRAIVQDMVDFYAYAQTDTGTFMGGWGYSINTGSSDNSANQWAAIGFLGGESVISNGPDGMPGTADDVKWAPTPDFVKQANRNSLNNTQASTANCGAFYDGAFAYTNNVCYFPWGPYGTTPAGMVQMVMDGIGRGNTQWERTENFIRTNFCNAGNSTTAIREYYYGLFSFTKAMLLSPGGGIQLLANQPGNLSPIDWYAAEASAGAPCDGVARTLVDDQLAGGNWGLHNIYGYHTGFSTSWAIIMLNQTVFSSGVPVAVATATPNPAVAGQIIQLDGSTSFHQDAGKLVDSWEWDLDNNGTYETSGPFPTVSFPVLGDYVVRLRVTDNGSPEASATTTVTVRVTIPPIAPTARAGGPYNFCPSNQPWFLDGGGSINPDEGQSEPGLPGDTIVSYLWDLDGDGQYDDAAGMSPDVTAYFVTVGPGNYLVQLRATDRTATSFPSSGMGDLSDTDSGVVNVLTSNASACTCVDDMAARAKPGKVQLTWTHSGAHHYNVYRGTISGGPYLRIASTTSTYSTYLDMDVVNGTTYYYVIRPSNVLDRETCQSNQSMARPVAGRTR